MIKLSINRPQKFTIFSILQIFLLKNNDNKKRQYALEIAKCPLEVS